MKNKITLLIILCTLISCKKGKIEFVQSKICPNFFLVKNASPNDSILKQQIKSFLIRNNPLKNTSYVFYTYNSNTEYFLENEEYDGFGAKVLSMYQKDNIAYFSLFNNQDNNLVKGELIFYGNENKLYERDTLNFR